MNLYGITIEQVEQAIAACNAGFYAGGLRFDQTNKAGAKYISGVLRHNDKDAPGARPHSLGRPKKSRFADWQGHYDFMEQVLILQPDGRITTRWYGQVDYRGLLGFYALAGQTKRAPIQHMGVCGTYVDLVGHGRE